MASLAAFNFAFMSSAMVRSIADWQILAMAIWQKVIDVSLAIWQISLMELSEYIKAQGLTPSGFAEQIGVPPSTITRVMSGKRKPGFDLLEKIHAATNGAVEPNDFLPRCVGAGDGEDAPVAADAGEARG